jgi:hypothetical protein
VSGSGLCVGWVRGDVSRQALRRAGKGLAKQLLSRRQADRFRTGKGARLDAPASGDASPTLAGLRHEPAIRLMAP